MQVGDRGYFMSDRVGFACGMNELAKEDACTEKQNGKKVEDYYSIDLIKTLVASIFSSKEDN